MSRIWHLLINRNGQKGGYVITPGILYTKQVERLRDLCEALYENNLSDNQGEIIPSVCLQNPELINVIFDNTVVGALASVVGKGYNIFPNFHVKINSFVDWHTDKAFMDATRSEQPFSFVQCAVYLQPNNPETGGGLDVLPGTHRDTSKSDYVSELSKSLLLIDAK